MLLRRCADYPLGQRLQDTLPCTTPACDTPACDEVTQLHTARAASGVLVWVGSRAKEIAGQGAVMSTGKQPPSSDSPPPESLEPEWIEALKYSTVKGIVAWVVNRDNVIIDATAAVATVLGVGSLADVIGSHVDDHQHVLTTEPISALMECLQRVWSTGRPETQVVTYELPGRGLTEAIITTTLLTHPVYAERRWILRVGHDITDAGISQLWLREQCIQSLMVIMADDSHRCTISTEAAARFCGFSSAEEMRGKRIGDTPYAAMYERERQKIDESRVKDTPIFDLEWLTDAVSGHTSPFAITRIGFQQGGSMMIFHPVNPRKAFFMVDPVEALKASGDVRLSRTEFDILLDMYRHLPPARITIEN